MMWLICLQYQYDSPEIEGELEIVRNLWNTVLSMVQQSGIQRRQAEGEPGHNK